MSFFIQGKNKLYGTIEVESSKNALLPILAASVLATEKVTLYDVPEFSDIENMCKILVSLGAKIEKNERALIIDPIGINKTEIPKELSQKLRASIFLMGPLLSRFKNVKAYLPGGCKIGSRPIDIHLAGFEALGVLVDEQEDKIVCNSTNFCGGTYRLRMPSVGATENLIMCSVLSYLKVTIIENCAKEPEIVDLCHFLTKMGAKIYGEGTDKIIVVGVKKLKGATHKVIGDRIIAGTYMIATAMCGGKVCLKNANINHNKSLITILSNLGCTIDGNSDNIYITMDKLESKSVEIKTEPYPGFPTDLQSPLVSLLSITNGTHKVIENLFESRFNQIPELIKMGANILVNKNCLTVFGKHDCLKGKTVHAQDLRGGAALVLAGLVAKSETCVEGTEYIDRGYEHLENNLRALGAKIQRK